MIECAGLAVAEKPRDLGDRQIGFSQIALGEIEPQIVQNLAKAQAFPCEPAPQGPPADAKFSGDLVDTRLPVRQQRDDRILNF